MFIPLTERKLGPAELRDALTRAVSHKDIEAARELFDHAFWHKTPFKPDWFHLYIAVESENRDMVKLLATRGATWTEDQAKVAKLSLGTKCDAVKVILRGAGIRLDYSDTELATVEPQAALAMNRRILEENRKGGHDVSAEEKTFRRAVTVEMANAVLLNDMPRAKKALQMHPDADKPEGIDVSDIFAEVLGGFIDSSSKRALVFIDRLQNTGVKLQPINLHKISGLTMPQHYDLLPELDRRGLLQKDVAKLRREMIDSWSYMQESVDLEGYTLHIPPQMIEEKQAQFKQAAAVLCTPANKLEADDVNHFIRQHSVRLPRAPKALAQMDHVLLETGFFDNPAFGAEDLRTLAALPGLDTGLAAAFNKKAAQKEISGCGVDHFLHKKRFAVLENALSQGAFVPDRVETEAIVQYLYSRMSKETPSPEIIRSLKILKETGADFGRVRMRDYLGSSKPGMAKALLDLDIIEPRDINRVKLRKRSGPPANNLFGIDRNDKHYAMREFAMQVELEKIDPGKYKPYRGKENTNYQNLYLLHQMQQYRSLMRPTQQPTGSPPNLQRVLADQRRRRAEESNAQQERLRQIIQSARAREQQKAADNRERLREILERHHRRTEAEKENMRKHMEEILKRKRPNNRFGY